MKKAEAYEVLVKEYISKVECCDECCAYWYCVENKLRESRVPQEYCCENLKNYFKNVRKK